ncbi:MAG: hypothetical protein IPP07_23860 [Holophagales bacterium]|nr:hypothetical protein [Holophagales bacterium]
METMRRLQERGILDPALDLDDFLSALEEKGIVGPDGSGALALAASGERQLRRAAFEEIFSSLQKSGNGLHSLPRAGSGTELLDETRPWEPATTSPASTASRTLTNAARRDPETPALAPEDFEVHEVEHGSACATAIAIDISTR